MRQKDALASENTVLNKLAEKQQQKVEAANEIQRSLQAQLVRLSLCSSPLPSSFNLLVVTNMAPPPFSASHPVERMLI